MFETNVPLWVKSVWGVGILATVAIIGYLCIEQLVYQKDFDYDTEIADQGVPDDLAEAESQSMTGYSCSNLGSTMAGVDGRKKMEAKSSRVTPVPIQEEKISAKKKSKKKTG
jgi:hypothetical protein